MYGVYINSCHYYDSLFASSTQMQVYVYSDRTRAESHTLNCICNLENFVVHLYYIYIYINLSIYIYIEGQYKVI